MTPAAPDSPRHPGPMGRLRGYLLAGLLALGPTALTLWVLFIVVNRADALLGRYLKFEALGGQRIPGLGLAATFVLLVVVGWIVTALGRRIGGRSLLTMWEHLLTRIPGVGILYGSTKSLGEAFFASRHAAFKQVVLVPWPHPGIYRVGFVAGRATEHVRRALGGEVEVVFIPHTPNPASGFVHYVPKAQIVYLDWDIEDGLKVVISGGLVQPGQGGIAVPTAAGPAGEHAAIETDS